MARSILSWDWKGGGGYRTPSNTKCTKSPYAIIADTFSCCFSTTTVISPPPPCYSWSINTQRQRPNVNANSSEGVIAAFATDNFAPPSTTLPNTNIFDSSVTASQCSSNTASATTPQHPTTRDNSKEGIVPVSGWWVSALLSVLSILLPKKINHISAQIASCNKTVPSSWASFLSPMTQK